MTRLVWPALLVVALIAGLFLWSAGPARNGVSATSRAVPGQVPARQQQSTPRPQLQRAAAAHVTKVLTIIEENHSLSQMRSGMPYLYSLARRYAYANNYHAISHPSLPNYLAIAGGDTFGVRDDALPAAHRLRGATVFGQAFAHRRYGATYSESMPGRCSLTGNVNLGYAVKHNPWAYFPAERSRCRSYDVPETTFRRAAQTNRLPNVSLLVPNKCHDAHDCRLSSADAWLWSRLPVVLASRDFRSGNLMVVITADEDDSRSGNRVLTVVLHPRLAGSHKVVSTPLNHYSLSRLYSQVVGARPLRHAATARSMSAAFGLRVGP